MSGSIFENHDFEFEKPDEEVKFFITSEKIERSEEKTEDDIKKKALEEKERLIDKKQYNNHFYAIEGWFMRISTALKWKFLENIIIILNESGELRKIIKEIGPPTKDFLYAISQYTHNHYDKTYLDNNRNMDVLYLYHDHLKWMNELRDEEQSTVVLSLLHMCGGSLRHKFYCEAIKLLKASKSVPKIKKGFSFKKSYFRESFTLNSQAANPELKLAPPTSKSKRLLEKKLKEFQTKIIELQNSISDITSSTRKVETIDKIQILPLWINRKIFSELNLSTKNAMVSVSSFWKTALTDMKKEDFTTNWREKTVRKIEVKKLDRNLSTFGSKKTQVPQQKPIDGKKKRPKSAPSQARAHVDEEADSSLGRTMSLQLDLSCPELPVLERPSIFQRLYLYKKKHPPYYPYYGTFYMSQLYSSYMFTAKISATKRILAVGKENEVVFLNLLTGTQFNFKLDGLSSDISALAFDYTGRKLVIGSLDSKIKSWTMFANEAERQYLGCDGPINAMSINNDFIVSSTLNMTIKVFNIKTGVCALTKKIKTQPTVLHIDANNNIYVSSEQGKLLKFNVTDDSRSDPDTIEFAHFGTVTCMSVHPPFLISGGVDAFARVWNSSFSDVHSVLSLRHKWRVNAVLLSFMNILTAAEDGKLRVWDLEKGILRRVIDVNASRRPLLNMIGFQMKNHTKLIINCEDVIKVLEFPYDWVKSKYAYKLEAKGMKCYRAPRVVYEVTDSQSAMLERDNEAVVKRKKVKERRLEQLATRNAAPSALHVSLHVVDATSQATSTRTK